MGNAKEKLKSHIEYAEKTKKFHDVGDFKDILSHINTLEERSKAWESTANDYFNDHEDLLLGIEKIVDYLEATHNDLSTEYWHITNKLKNLLNSKEDRVK